MAKTADSDVHVVPATAIKNNFGAFLKQAYAEDRHIIVEKSGMPVAALISIADYQKHFQSSAKAGSGVARSAKVQRAAAELRQFLARAQGEALRVLPDEVEADIAAAIREVRGKRKPKRGK